MSVLCRVTLMSMVITVYSISSLVAPRVMQASDDASFCKWPYDWPVTVEYYIWPDFGSNDVRIQYGAETWTGATFNIIFQRVYSESAAGDSEIYRGSMSSSHANSTAVTYRRSVNYYGISVVNCDSDSGAYGKPYWELRQVDTVFNQAKTFYSDCLAAGSYCQNNGYYDYHNTATHEFGHWLRLRDSDLSGDSMYESVAPGDTYKRDLASHDRDNAWVMYGCRNGDNDSFCNQY